MAHTKSNPTTVQSRAQTRLDWNNALKSAYENKCSFSALGMSNSSDETRVIRARTRMSSKKAATAENVVENQECTQRTLLSQGLKQARLGV